MAVYDGGAKLLELGFVLGVLGGDVDNRPEPHEPRELDRCSFKVEASSENENSLEWSGKLADLVKERHSQTGGIEEGGGR